MKAVVLEIKDGVAAVLCEDGTVTRVRRKCAVGDTVELERVTHLAASRWLRTAIAAVLALVIVGGAGGYYTAYACSYVTLDADPSIEYALNRMNRVISVKALNDEAAGVVSELKDGGVRGKTLSEAVDRTMQILSDSGYLTGDGDYVLASVSSGSDERTQELSDELKRTVSDSSVNLYVVPASLSDRDAAGQQGLSTGRYEIAKTGAAQSGTGTDTGDYKNEPVKKLLQDAGDAANTTAEPAESGDAGTVPAPAAPSENVQAAPEGSSGIQPPPAGDNSPLGPEEGNAEPAG